jgi:hypothetical protein
MDFMVLDRRPSEYRARSGSVGRAEEAEHVTELALLLARAGVEQAHVGLARLRVKCRRADGVAHQVVGLMHVAQLHGVDA